MDIKFNASTQKFERTDPTIVINNKISANEFNLFDYSTKNDNTLGGYQKPTLPELKKNNFHFHRKDFIIYHLTFYNFLILLSHQRYSLPYKSRIQKVI